MLVETEGELFVAALTASLGFLSLLATLDPPVLRLPGALPLSAETVEPDTDGLP